MNVKSSIVFSIIVASTRLNSRIFVAIVAVLGHYSRFEVIEVISSDFYFDFNSLNQSVEDFIYGYDCRSIVLSIRKTFMFSTLLMIMFMMQSISIVADPSWKDTTSVSSTQEKISIHVAEAYYADIDADGVEDDVFTRIELTLRGANRYNFDLWTTLTLPSGQDFVFGWGINTRLSFLNVSIDMLNTAIEPGWYNLLVESVMKTGGVSYTALEHIFDPPGPEICCSPPSATMTIG